MAGPTRRPFGKAFACAGLLFLLLLGAAFASLGSPASAEGAGEVVGRLAFMVLVPALITGLLARRARTAWSFLRIAGVFLLIFILVGIVQAAGYDARTRV